MLCTFFFLLLIDIFNKIEAVVFPMQALITFSQIKTTLCVLSSCPLIWPNICITITNQRRAMFICFYKPTYLEFSK